MKQHEIELFKNLNDALKDEINRFAKFIAFKKTDMFLIVMMPQSIFIFF